MIWSRHARLTGPPTERLEEFNGDEIKSRRVPAKGDAQ